MAATPLYTPTPVDWVTATAPMDYARAVTVMEARAKAIADNQASEMIWLLEHPPLYTAGTSAKPADLIDPTRFDVFRSGRGGQYTYHGPGQRVVYVMLDLRQRGRDVGAFVRGLEQWIIDTLAGLGVVAERRQGRVGVWVDQARYDSGLDGDAKIAAIGVRLKKWVSFHGMSINVDPDLSHFAGIIPCGQAEHDVTSVKALNRDISMADLDAALKRNFEKIWGPVSQGR